MGIEAEHGTSIIASQIPHQLSLPGYPHHQAPYTSLSNRHPSFELVHCVTRPSSMRQETIERYTAKAYAQCKCPKKLLYPSSRKAKHEKSFRAYMWLRVRNMVLKIKTRCADRKECTQPYYRAHSPSAAAFSCLPSWVSLCR